MCYTSIELIFIVTPKIVGCITEVRRGGTEVHKENLCNVEPDEYYIFYIKPKKRLCETSRLLRVTL